MNKMVILLFILSTFSLDTVVNGKPSEPKDMKPYEAEHYVTPEDVVRDIIFPVIDRRVMNEYGGKESSGFGWQQQRIVNIVYNNNHSYDISLIIDVPENKDNRFESTEDLVKVRVSPSCDSPKIGCSHGFKVEVLDYQHK